ncbi:hypothetical protein ACFXHD_02880 [Streptomyces hydrogenans]|uniref:hypothetical protein n=1 Tax=Streptomyces hydrogenans TaxID=1873719 RepID=UPI0036CDB2E8
MPRLQILELPEGPDDDRPPFALVIDQVDMTLANALANVTTDGAPFADMATRLGARTVLVFGETIEIPANELPVDKPLYITCAGGVLRGALDCEG